VSMSTRKQSPATPRRLRVLIIEDNADGREMLRLLLELFGYEVLVAADGVAGVEEALRAQPDVAVVDIGLPRLDGYQVAQHLRSSLERQIFLITQTSYGRPEVAERMLELFRGRQGVTRGELEEDLREAFGDDPGQLVHQGLAKLLEDRCEFEMLSGHPPEQLRAVVFHAAAGHRQALASAPG